MEQKQFLSNKKKEKFILEWKTTLKRIMPKGNKLYFCAFLDPRIRNSASSHSILSRILLKRKDDFWLGKFSLLARSPWLAQYVGAREGSSSLGWRYLSKHFAQRYIEIIRSRIKITFSGENCPVSQTPIHARCCAAGDFRVHTRVLARLYL